MHLALRPVSVINPVKMERGRGRSTATQPHKESGKAMRKIYMPFCVGCSLSAAAAQYLKTKYYESKFAPQWRETERGTGQMEEGGWEHNAKPDDGQSGAEIPR